MSQDLLINLVPYVVPVIIIFSASIAAAAYQHLLQWLPPNKRATLEYAVNCAVHAVEQVMVNDLKDRTEMLGREPLCRTFRSKNLRSMFDTISKLWLIL
jgi:hypothetical protein